MLQWPNLEYVEHGILLPGLIDCNTRTNTSWESECTLTSRALRGGVVLLLLEESIHGLPAFPSSKLYTDIIYTPVLQDSVDLQSVNPQKIYKTYLSDPSRSVKAIKNLEEVLSVLETPLIVMCNLPDPQHSSINSPLHFHSIKKRGSLRIAPISINVSGINCEQRASSDEELEGEDLPNTVTSLNSPGNLSPDLIELESSIRSRKNSSTELYERELAQYIARAPEHQVPVPAIAPKKGRPPPISTSKVAPSYTYADLLLDYPDMFEIKGVEAVLNTLKTTKGKVHFANLSSSEAALLASKFKQVFDISIETSPHYLTYSSREINPLDTRFKLCPPIRSFENMTEMWKMFELKSIDIIASMHEYVELEFKALNSLEFKRSLPGLPVNGYCLSALWTRFMNEHPHLEPNELEKHFVRIVQMMSFLPAKRFELRKYGEITEGAYANFCVFDCYGKVDNTIYNDRSSPYEEKTMFGKVKKVIFKGKVAYDGLDHYNFGQILSDD